MEIEVGEWVRTPEEGFIGKLVEINEDVINYYKIDVGREIKHRDDFIDNYIYSRDGFGLLHSKNIIDLIQEGDILRIKVQFHHEIELYYILKEITDKKGSDWDFLIEQINLCHYEIKSIVTKEQFSSVEYLLEEE